jgi:putative membrane protein
VYFAAERTLLAWVRTGVAVIGLGFVVARFGLFLQLVSPANQSREPHTLPAILGTGIVLVGSLCMAVAGVQFRGFLRSLSPAEKPRPALTAPMGLLLAFTLSAAGLFLSAYLLM